MTFGSTFGRTFSPTFQPKSQAAVVASSWWLSGGIAAANCIAAYQPKGAASYAASLVNLTGNTTYDATEGNAPDWDATNGWEFAAASSHWLYVDYVVPNDQSHTIIARYSNVSSAPRSLSLARGTGNTCDFGLYVSDQKNTNYYSGNYKTHNHTTKTASIDAIAGAYYFVNGTKINDAISSGTGTQTVKQPIGCMDARGTRSLYFTGYVQAFALYSSVLTDTQIGNLYTAMAAL